MKRNLCIVGGIALFLASVWGFAWAFDTLHRSDWRVFPTMFTVLMGATAGIALVVWGTEE